MRSDKLFWSETFAQTRTSRRRTFAKASAGTEKQNAMLSIVAATKRRSEMPGGLPSREQATALLVPGGTIRNAVEVWIKAGSTPNSTVIFGVFISKQLRAFCRGRQSLGVSLTPDLWD